MGPDPPPPFLIKHILALVWSPIIHFFDKFSEIFFIYQITNKTLELILGFDLCLFFFRSSMHFSIAKFDMAKVSSLGWPLHDIEFMVRQKSCRGMCHLGVSVSLGRGPIYCWVLDKLFIYMFLYWSDDFFAILDFKILILL
jgi:hypothetical protein